MRSTHVRRLLSTALIPVLFATFTGLPAVSGDDALFHGRVFDQEGATPLEGVIVRLAEPGGDTVYDSVPTGPDGLFRIENVPAGEYDLLARNDTVAFLAAESYPVAGGGNRPVALRLTSNASLAPAQAKQGELPMWGKIMIGGGIAIAALFLIDHVTEDVEEQASPF